MTIEEARYWLATTARQLYFCAMSKRRTCQHHEGAHASCKPYCNPMFHTQSPLFLHYIVTFPQNQA